MAGLGYSVLRIVLLVAPRASAITLSRHQGILHELSFSALDLRVYRRVIEIRDGLMALRRYTPVHLPDEAMRFVSLREVPADVLDVTVTACIVEVARRAKVHGGPAPESVADSSHLMSELAQSDVLEEVESLCRLAEVNSDPLVKEFADSVPMDPINQTNHGAPEVARVADGRPMA
ncbi:DUF6545 domain-containing protein [Plantactinospora sp. KBS50]|uniref:DUF6545 domain-containing protein n=1 Tax=Plantactinospora sp. KBS50 TaxID=2024580 RepID=UPI0012FDC44E|nr:DUF6545 domain-containing protein [Plantactinospora sp. KBS50]